MEAVKPWWHDVEPAPQPQKKYTDLRGRTWVREATRAGTYGVTETRDGLWWYQAPLPRRWHRCAPQTRGWVGAYGLTYIERCACGATRLAVRGPWTHKNERRMRR